MIGREEYLEATEKISYDMIDVLCKWLQNEKGNLDSYIENPEGHIMFNRYVKADIEALTVRSAMLSEVCVNLRNISLYKQGSDLSTRALHDYGFDSIHYSLFERLLDWMNDRKNGLVTDLEKQKMGIPLSDYNPLATFDTELFQSTIKEYMDAIEGVETVIAYKKQPDA